MMKKTTISRWLQITMMVAIAVVATTCATDKDNLNTVNENVLLTPTAYEGEWKVNDQMVDTARLEVTAMDGGDVAVATASVRLPGQYLLSNYVVPLYAQAKGYEADDVSFEVFNQYTDLRLMMQGYSQQSQFLSFAQSSSPGYGYQVVWFLAKIDDTMYRVILMSKDTVIAILQKGTGQWTLGIRIDGILLSDMYASMLTELPLQLPTAVNLYYSTKRRIG